MSNTLDGIQTRPSTARVIGVLRAHRLGIALRELARLADVAPSTAHRVAHQLEARALAAIERAGQERRVVLRERRRGLPGASLQLSLAQARAYDGPIHVVDHGARHVVAMPAAWRDHVSVSGASAIAYFKKVRPLQWASLRPEDEVIALLALDPAAAERRRLGRGGVHRARLRRRLLEEDVALASISAELARLVRARAR